MGKATTALILLLSVSGCTSYAERVAATCRRMGMGPGTEDYAPCVHQQMEIDQRDRAMWAGVAGMGAASLSTSQYRPRMVTCSQNGAFTNCY